MHTRNSYSVALICNPVMRFLFTQEGSSTPDSGAVPPSDKTDGSQSQVSMILHSIASRSKHHVSSAIL